ncbi:MAG: hypothetical protein A2147_03710 [Chloroflexi bacterium RBG_16_57_8]|nr:MAG: hypothetical protein A2147_03710 [Chloroflexi bacterium RBG_16_57_8]
MKDTPGNTVPEFKSPEEERQYWESRGLLAPGRRGTRGEIRPHREESIAGSPGTSFAETAYYQKEFIAVHLSDEDVRTVKFEECHFDDCSFVRCKFENCAFIDCKFDRCVLSAINPAGSRFLQPAFSRCKVIGFDWAKAGKLHGLDFSDGQLDYSNFSSLQLPRIRIVKCCVREASFTEMDMSDGIFTDTDFLGSTFFKTDLSRADFRRAKSYCIDVKNNVIKNARFSLPEVLSLLDGLNIVIE